MARHVTIVREDDYAYLKKIILRRLADDRGLPGQAWPRADIEACQRLLKEFDHASGSGAPTPERKRSYVYAEGSEETPAKLTQTATALVLCGMHPNYTGQRKPRTGCKGCLAAYERLKA